jgi:hypothetical protein
VNVTINERTSLGVKVTNSCGATAVSELVFADLCGLPSVVKQPVSPSIANGASVNAGPLQSTTTFWATVTNACGEIPVRAVTVYVIPPNRPARGRSVRH